MAQKKKTTRQGKRKKAKTRSEPRVSRQRRPDNMSPEDWQTLLRRQFGSRQSYQYKNLGNHPFFSEFSVSNPESGGRYRVAIRGMQVGENFCSCPDFATNDLGTCKHIEFVLTKLAARRGSKTALSKGFQPPYSEIYLRYGGMRRLCFRAGTDCPPRLKSAAEKLFGNNAGTNTAAQEVPEFEPLLASAQRSGHELRCYDDALAFAAELRDAGKRRKLFDSAYPKGAGDPKLKKLLSAPLYPYQAEGALFAARAGRVLIGDEMGLGKTIQAIAAAELLLHHCGIERILIVCPTSLKHQWQREIHRFSGRAAQVIHGPRVLRRQQYRDESYCKITSYEALVRDLDCITPWAADLIIVDEAQRIKNWNTVAARALKRIDNPYAFVLTGTPLENRLEELISIVQFVDQHRLGPTWRLLHNHQLRDDSGRVIGYRELDRIGATLAPVMLRRRKRDVIDQLPERIDKTLFVEMTEPQMALHAENGEIVGRVVQRWRKNGFLSDADQRRLTCALQNMRMSCNSTYLLDQETDHGLKIDELIPVLEDLFEQPQAKVVIFSQWLRTHELIIRRLEALGWGYVLFHGGIPSEKRPALIDQFRDDANCRLFLSTDAGGVGLNLQHAAATVINMDLPWNPAVLEQRIGRVYRLGQTRNVQVVNLVAQGTIEENMLSLLAFKQSLFAGVLDGGNNQVFLEGSRLSQFMQSVDQVAAATNSTQPLRSAIAPDTKTESAIGNKTTGKSKQQRKKKATSAEPSQSTTATTQADADTWATLITAGLKLVETIAAAQATPDTAENRSTASWIENDASTGKPYLKLPLPEPAVVQQLAGALTEMLRKFEH
jgi:superfamily II DNA or RNA helicase